jgi:FAD/FMN-containing dehydrogenase
MRGVAVDQSRKEITFGGGALASDVVGAAQAAELQVVTGYSGAIGMAGLLLGGGYGPLVTGLGLAADCLLEAEVVLEDGRLVTANETDNAELFWALRGGGGNFGVVTSMRIRAHVLSTIVSGLIMFPWADAAAVLRGYADMMPGAPDELSMAAILAVAPSGDPIVVLAPTWTGDPVHSIVDASASSRAHRPSPELACRSPKKRHSRARRSRLVRVPILLLCRGSPFSGRRTSLHPFLTDDRDPQGTVVLL